MCDQQSVQRVETKTRPAQKPQARDHRTNERERKTKTPAEQTQGNTGHDTDSQKEAVICVT